MSQDWQINPEDTRSVYIMTNSGNKISKTIAQIKALINAHGFNSCILAKALYYASGDAYMILTNYGNAINTLYLGGSTYLSTPSQNSIGFSFPQRINFEQTTRWLLNDSGTDIFNRTGATMNYVASSKVVNNVTYYYIINEYADSTYPPIYVTTYSGDIYYDGEPPITYNWQSVPSISGKNGILTLAQIKDDYINDGEPVSGAAKSRFSNLKDGNKVSVLIENVLPDPAATGTDVTVKYDVPSLSSGSYTYCKLVAKKNSMPESVTDGDKIVDLDPTKASVTVKYLSGNTKYYFEIFTQDSEGHEGVSNVKSITTGETHDIVLFTNEFNTSILKSGWALDVYKSMFSNASTGWAPTSFTSDFLSNYNFLCGNGSRRQLSMSNGELWTANETGMTDQTFWIPIERTYINESIVVSFDGKISPIGWSSSYYNYIHVWLAYVDDNNTWHSYNACGDIVTDQQWHTFEHEVQPQFPYIDYIGLCCCDGSSHWKNVKVINS